MRLGEGLGSLAKLRAKLSVALSVLGAEAFTAPRAQVAPKAPAAQAAQAAPAERLGVLVRREAENGWL